MDCLLILIAIFFQCTVSRIVAEEPLVILRPESGFNASEGSGATTFNCTLSGFASVPANTFVQLTGSSGRILEEDYQARGISTEFRQTSAVVKIEASLQNNNISILCGSVLALNRPPILSLSEVFQVQGVLDPPQALGISPSGSSPSLNILSWTAPFSLDLTDIDPDIIGYNICCNISAEPSCFFTEKTTYEFLNVRLPLEFRVSAINVVGESPPNVIGHPPCNDQNAASFISDYDWVSVQVSIAQNGTYFFSIILEQPLGITCHTVYTLQLQTLPSGNRWIVGPLLPVVIAVQTSVQILEIEGQSNLEENQIFGINIITGNDNEPTMFGTFSTYDVQNVSLLPLPWGLRVHCSFLANSDARGCVVTLSKVEGESEIFFTEIQLERSNPTADVAVSVAGFYVVTEVSEIEGDGRTTNVSNLSYLSLPLLGAYIGASTTTGNSSATATETAQSSSFQGVVIGVAVGMPVLILLLVSLLLVATVLYLYFLRWKRRHKLEINKINLKDLDDDESGELSANNAAASGLWCKL